MTVTSEGWLSIVASVAECICITGSTAVAMLKGTLLFRVWGKIRRNGNESGNYYDALYRCYYKDPAICHP